MSPRVNRRCLSSRCSRERHCGRVVIAPAFALAAASAFAGTFTLPLFGQSASTFLPPLAPPIYVDRFHSYYEGSDFCRRDRIRHIEFAPTESMPIGRPGPCSPSGPIWIFPDSHSHCRRQISLLIAFEFPTIPPPTTTLPFRCDRFITLRHRRSLPCLSLGLTRWSREFAVARSRVRSFLGVSPTGLAESSSLALRTGLSPQIALHLPSRKRSYHCRLQAGNVSLTGTYTLLFKRLHRRTRSGTPVPDFRGGNSFAALSREMEHSTGEPL